MLLLSLVPCSDGIDIFHPTCDADTEIVERSHNHSDHDHEDMCTPFCICSCCGSMSVMPTVAEYRDRSDIISTLCLFHYESIYSLDYSKGVWHPPTIS